MSGKQGVKGDLKQGIFNAVNENVKALEALFPAAVKDGQVDFEALKEELGQFEEVGPEKYGLTWSGKQNAKKIALEDSIGKTLKFVPEESVNPDTTENLYIEGDNLEVLKLLRQNYYGAIKMIYIDPPYNTGNDFIYRDKFNMDVVESDVAEGVMTEEQERLQRNLKSTNRFHANWLNMMYPRLKVAKDLLRDDGAIFISIDGNEVDNIKKVCNEIFGEANFISYIANINNPKGRSDDKYVATAHENIIIYAKLLDRLAWYGFEPTEEIIKRYTKVDSNGNKYREIDLRKTGENDLRQDRPNLFYYFYYNEQSGDFYPSRDSNIPEGYLQIKPQRQDGKEGNWRWGIETTEKQIDRLIPKFMPSRKIWGIMEKDYLENRSLVKPTSSWTFKDVNSERGTEEFINLGFDKRIFHKPKPVGTISRCLKLSTLDSDIILDFFSGSSTSAHSVMQLNAEDGGNRKFIMVQIPEVCDDNSEAKKAGYNTICEIGKERIRRAGNKIKEEIEESNAKLQIGDTQKTIPDIGFKVFKIADTMIRWNYEDIQLQRAYLESAATSEVIEGQNLIGANMMNHKDQLDFMPYAKDIDVVYEILLRQRDIPLSAPVEQLAEIGKRTYLFADSFLVCLETEITTELIEKIAALSPLPIKFVFRDSAFEDDINLKDETIRRFKALVARNTNKKQSAYTVEFI